MFFTRRHLGNTNEAMSLTLFGISVYVVSRAEDISEVYRNTRTLNGDEFFRHVFGSIGTSRPSIIKSFSSPTGQIKDVENPLGKPVAHLIRDMQIQQLQPGSGLDAIQRSEMAYLEKRVRPESVSLSRYRYPGLLNEDKGDPSLSNVVELRLWRWCSDLLVRASQGAFFGNALERIDPNLADRFSEFDEISWKLWYQIPGFLARDTIAVRDQLRATMKRFYDLPQAERNDGSYQAWVNDKAEDKLRAIGVPTEDIASIQLILYWGTNAMTRKAAFWLISHLLYQPAIIDAIRAETRPAFGPDGSLADLTKVLENSPQLEAAWNETMRMYASSASVRMVTADTVISGRRMRPGHRVMIPYRQLHRDESVWGGDVKVWRPSRWLNKEGTALSTLGSRADHFRPFGGGSTICPGRFISKNVTMMFVALVLHRFDIAMAGGHQPFPEPELFKPVLGIMDIKSGEDMRIRLTPRKDGV
ncbi:cytochrome p450 [Diaporthe sp. PMI_573]|nr:cytochrome p450 [Diaporthaceae sp. PMI_573]